VNATILLFPKNRETKNLLTEQNINPDDYDEGFLNNITESVRCIRRTHGSLIKSHIKPIIELLEHHWIPSDIPVILPEPFIIKEN
jgi:hypothetical protein